MRVTYEWDIETLDPATGDILDHHHADKLSDLLPHYVTQDPTMRLVLIREVGDNLNGLIDRLWAYADDHWNLPRHFSDSAEAETSTRIPQRFYREIAKAAG